MRGSLRWAAAVLALVAATAGLAQAGLADQPANPGNEVRKYDIGLIGDTRYSAENRAKFPNVIQDMNAANLAFIVHDGDVKNGSDPCTDQNLVETRDGFNQFAAPLIYTPGDNEWTDCHRTGQEPLQRLALIRQMFFAGSQSLGIRKITLERQSAQYPENQRWSWGDVLYATIHVIGSNNNLGRTPEQDQEYISRNNANLDWIASTFDWAQARGSAAVLLVMQADPWSPELTTDFERLGFKDTLETLQRRTIQFGKPVVLITGDHHYFTIDKPLNGTKSKRLIENFTRVETFGSTEGNHWVRASIDPADPNVFTFRPQIVKANLNVQTP